MELWVSQIESYGIVKISGALMLNADFGYCLPYPIRQISHRSDSYINSSMRWLSLFVVVYLSVTSDSL